MDVANRIEGQKVTSARERVKRTFSNSASDQGQRINVIQIEPFTGSMVADVAPLPHHSWPVTRPEPKVSFSTTDSNSSRSGSPAKKASAKRMPKGAPNPTLMLMQAESHLGSKKHPKGLFTRPLLPESAASSNFKQHRDDVAKRRARLPA